MQSMVSKYESVSVVSMMDCTGGTWPSRLGIHTRRQWYKLRVEKSVSLQTSWLGQIPSRLIWVISRLEYFLVD